VLVVLVLLDACGSRSLLARVVYVRTGG